MYRVCGLRLGPKYVERLTAEKNLQPYGCSNTVATINCTNPKVEILNEAIEIQIIGIQINYLFLY